MGVVVAKGLEDSCGLWVELCFGDAFVYQTCPSHLNFGQFNMKNAINALIFWGASGGI